MDTITGCWEGALIPANGGAAHLFALRQPERILLATGVGTGPTLALDGGASTPARLLEAAARALVALVEDAPDGGRPLLLEARVADGRLVGHWLRRDESGRVVDEGRLEAMRRA